MPSRPNWLLYGAYGFTGRLVAHRAVERGLRPVLAGRDGDALRRLADELRLESRVFGLDDPDAVRAGLRGMRLVLHTAGPFSATWRPMLEACLAEGCHYLDVTGEIEVLEAIQTRNGAAAAAGVYVVPAVGFDVVPTDCAAALAAGALDEPRTLDLAFHVTGGPSRGTARTTLERLGQPGAIRRGGRIVEVPMGSMRRRIPFADRPRDAVAIPWGDVSTAYRSTGVPDVRVFATLPAGPLRLARWAAPFLELALVRRLATGLVDAFVEGPDADELASGSARAWAEARNDAGEVARVELRTPNAYRLTTLAAVAAAERVLADELRVGPGAHTPSLAFGPDFAERLPGVERVE